MRVRRFSRLFLSMGLCFGGCTASSDDPAGMDGSGVGMGAAGLAGALAPVGAGGAGTAGGSGAAGIAATSGTGGASGSAAAGAGTAGGDEGGSGGAGEAGEAGSTAGAGGGNGGNGGAGGAVEPPTEHFSFFVTSLEAMVELAGNEQGFGGDLRFGEATGLEGADKICATIADMSMPNASAKQWRAFLSTAAGGATGGPVHAKDRIGEGPWYDRMGRLVAMDLNNLLATRPMGGDSLIANDLPNEHGEPNHLGVDNHDTVTASDEQGEYDGGPTCEDWTDAPPLEAGDGGETMFGGGGGERTGPTVGHSWPANSGQSWASAHQAAGCAAGVNLVQNGGGSGNGIGAGGGYGGIYCFALLP